MIVTGNIDILRKIVSKERKNAKIISFVPTMGALHKGHLSLVKRAKKDADFLVASIFINPLQFGPREDHKRYPRTKKKDQDLLSNEGVDLLFYPQLKVMYDSNFSVFVDELSFSNVLCGKSRPGHFRGVCTVVAKLFNIVNPDIVYFGQKDYQQVQIVKRLVRDLNFPIKIKILPIVREKNGLAMSSRNNYLSKERKKEAACLYEALLLAKRLINDGKRNQLEIIDEMKKVVKYSKNNKIDYIKIVNVDTLKETKKIKGKILIVLAVYVGGIRLIDNIILNVKK